MLDWARLSVIGLSSFSAKPRMDGASATTRSRRSRLVSPLPLYQDTQAIAASVATAPAVWRPVSRSPRSRHASTTVAAG